MSSSPEITAVLLIHALEPGGESRFAHLRHWVDEIVAVVDERVSECVARQLEKIGARIHRAAGDPYRRTANEYREIMTACNGRWLLWLDSDEELSPDWYQPGWRALLSAENYTHFWLARRWLVSTTSFIDRAPWWPDWQLRLLRNNPDAVAFPRFLHEPLSVAGRGGYLRRLAVHHHDFLITSEIERKAKVANYERVLPDGSLSLYYLPESYELKALPIPPAMSFGLEDALLVAANVPANEAGKIAIAISRLPRRMDRNTLFWITLQLVNQSSVALASGGPNLLNISYHWIHASSGAMAVFEGLRSAILPELAPGQTGIYTACVLSPSEAGEYLLQFALVQEHVQWLTPTILDNEFGIPVMVE